MGDLVTFLCFLTIEWSSSRLEVGPGEMNRSQVSSGMTVGCPHVEEVVVKVVIVPLYAQKCKTRI